MCLAFIIFFLYHWKNLNLEDEEMRIPLLAIFYGLLFCSPAAGPAFADTAADEEVRRDFEAVLDLWRDERYDELHRRTYPSGNVSKESFIRKLSAAGVRPACCWEKLQEVRVTLSDSGKATLHARVGLETGGTVTDYRTRSFRLHREDGAWKPASSDLLSLAGSARRRARR